MKRRNIKKERQNIKERHKMENLDLNKKQMILNGKHKQTDKKTKRKEEEKRERELKIEI